MTRMQRRNLEDDGNNGGADDNDNEGPGPENDSDNEETKGEP